MKAAFLVAVLAASGAAYAGIVVDGRNIEVVDMHLHPGRFSQMPASAVDYLSNAAPGPARLFLPALFMRLQNPYAEHIGIKEQNGMAGVDHAVLLTVYTQLTSGYFTNEQMEEVLTDPRNVSGDTTPGRANWAWGLASINFEGYLEPGVAEARLAAVDSYLERLPDLFIGIKLAHTHQGVAFDDDRYWGIYDVAAKHSVPVLLHTGFSPFPNSQDEPRYYDPQYLESLVCDYDGTHGKPRVVFILAHTGQGDARSVEHALELAEAHENIYIDLSALKRPQLRDENGQSVTQTEYQYPYVIAEVKKRGIVSRTMWSSDGPQYSGMERRYLGLLVEQMKSEGYTLDEIEAILSGNFYRLFFKDGSE